MCALWSVGATETRGQQRGGIRGECGVTTLDASRRGIVASPDACPYNRPKSLSFSKTDMAAALPPGMVDMPASEDAWVIPNWDDDMVMIETPAKRSHTQAFDAGFGASPVATAPAAGGSAGRTARSGVSLQKAARGRAAAATPVAAPAAGDDSSVSGDSRRQTHNASEQRRVRRINEQLARLRDILMTSSKRVDRNDKCSILAATADYIEDLQKELSALKLQPTQAPPRDATKDSMTVALARLNAAASSSTAIDYGRVFASSAIAQSVVSVTGQMLDVNQMFSFVSGFSREELLGMSMFNLTPSEELPVLYAIIYEMMSIPGRDTKEFRKLCIWKGRTMEVQVRMSLVRDDARRPLYFSCSLVPITDPRTTHILDSIADASPYSMDTSNSSSLAGTPLVATPTAL